MDQSAFDTSLPAGQRDSDTGTRKLAAIMFTDIKDFSGRMQRDEDAAMRMLRVHNTMMHAAVAKYSGMVIKTVGDAFLISFNSVVSATQCAIEVQQNFHDHNLNFKSDDDKILVRIGVHLGDVIETDRDIFGDGVNIASRVQSLAEAGGLNISESVYQQVKNKLNIRVLDLGVPQLKGIDEPIRIYQVIVIPSDKARGTIATNLYVFRTILRRKKTKRMIGIAAAAVAMLVAGWYFFLGPKAPPNSIAILPFKMIGDSSNVYIADGIAEDIYNYLSRTGSIHVVPSRTTQAVDVSHMSELDLARRFGVRFLITGYVELTKGGRFALRARLYDPFDKSDRWGNTYRGLGLDDIPNFEADIIRQIQTRISSDTVMIDENVPASAREDYYQGLDHDRRQTKEDNQFAIEAFRSAIDKYPQYVDARLKLANCEIVNRENGYDLSERWLTDAEEHVKRVFEIDSTNAELYAVWGRLLLARNQRQQGIAYLERSIQMNPNNMRAYPIIGWEYLQNQNNPAKALYYFTKAYDLEPSNFNTSMNLGISYAYQKNYTEAVKAFRRATILNPDHELPWFNLGYLYTLTASYDSAEISYREALRLNPSNPRGALLYSTVLIKEQKYIPAESTLVSALRYDPKNYGLLYNLAFVKARLGNPDSSRALCREGLRLAEGAIAANPSVAEHYLYAGLFSARLADAEKGARYGMTAFAKDSSEASAIGLAKIYAALGKKSEMVDWFGRARSMNPEYDPAYISTEFDFEKFRNDPELLAVAKK